MEKVKIFLDNQSKVLKILQKNENLKSLREKLGINFQVDTVFTSDEAEIDPNEEKDFTIEDIIKDNIIYMKTKKLEKNKNEIEVDIQINNVFSQKKNMDKSIKLNEVRRILNGKMSKDSVFIMEDGAKIEPTDEKDFILSDVLEGNQLKISEESAPSPAIGEINNKTNDSSEKESKMIKEEKVSVDFYIDDELKYSKKLINTTQLNDVRDILIKKINKNNVFLNINGEIITNDDEKNIQIYKIIKDNKVYLKTIKENNNKSEGNKKFDIYINGKLIYSKKLNENDTLNKIREQIKKKLPNDTHFILKNGIEVDSGDEEDYELSEILENNKINMKSSNEISKTLTEKNNDNITPENNSNEKNDNNPPNKPVEGSILIKKDGELEIYQYPYKSIIFTEEEEKKAIRLMVIGPTGSGKTTLLNSYINYLMGIQYNDNFRYKIIHEDFGTNQDTSQTSDVIEYYIKAKNGRLYQIIDTPGFGDTAGIKKDIEITNKITDFFLYRINTINAVCLVTKSSENRLSATQSYIFNCIFDLFGEDTKKLFIAMLTFSDGEEANALSFLQSDKCLFSKMIECDNQEWYFKFNNSAILKRNKKD